ncbi:MAG TPA: hypothetical protein VLF66_05920 [Thermoanaerobaculia bacterium]|nr:hypothetical protein [Thermoanaerobaculia bacterium]
MTDSASWKRLLIEVLVVLLVALAGYGAWWWCARQAERGAEELARDYEARIAAVEEGCEAWASAMAAEQAEAVLRSFAAGAYPSLMEGRPGEELDVAVGALLELPGVEFAHLLDPEGTVLASSDRKFTVLGEVRERAEWALGATELTSRQGERAGTEELAAPILSTEGTEAILWLAYDTQGVKEGCRPEGSGGTRAPGDGAASG